MARVRKEKERLTAVKKYVTYTPKHLEQMDIIW